MVKRVCSRRKPSWQNNPKGTISLKKIVQLSRRDQFGSCVHENPCFSVVIEFLTRLVEDPLDTLGVFYIVLVVKRSKICFEIVWLLNETRFLCSYITSLNIRSHYIGKTFFFLQRQHLKPVLIPNSLIPNIFTVG